MGRKIETLDGKSYNLDSTEHESQQQWRDRLYFVSSFPNRLVGIIEGDPTSTIKIQPIRMYGTLIYVSELVFQPVVEVDGNGQPVLDPATKRPRIVGVQGGTKLQCLVPYDFLGEPAIDVVEAQYIMKVADQEKKMASWLFDEYIRHFDPPRIARPGL